MSDLYRIVVLANLDNLQVCLDFTNTMSTFKIGIVYDESSTKYTRKEIEDEVDKMIVDVLRE